MELRKKSMILNSERDNFIPKSIFKKEDIIGLAWRGLKEKMEENEKNKTNNNSSTYKFQLLKPTKHKPKKKKMFFFDKNTKLYLESKKVRTQIEKNQLNRSLEPFTKSKTSVGKLKDVNRLIKSISNNKPIKLKLPNIIISTPSLCTSVNVDSPKKQISTNSYRFTKTRNMKTAYPKIYGINLNEQVDSELGQNTIIENKDKTNATIDNANSILFP